MNENFIYDYDHEAVIRKTENSIRYEGYEEGKKDGIEEGYKEKQIEIAKSMLAKNLDVEIISECTKLSIDEIKMLNCN